MFFLGCSLKKRGRDRLKIDVFKCSSCNQVDLTILHDFGLVPLAGYFPFAEQVDSANLVEMRLLRCETCDLVQVDPIVDDEYLFSDYRYRSFFAMNKHFSQLSEWLVAKGFKNGEKILEIGSNDGTLLQHLIGKGFNPIGVDPAANIVQYSKQLGHEVLIGHFSKSFVKENGLTGAFDLAISCNSFAHIQGIRGIASAVYMSLKSDGYFLIEVQSWEELIRLRAFDFIYHEHKYYYNKTAMEYLLALEGFNLVSAEIVESHGGSWRFLFRKSKEVPSTKFGFSGTKSLNNDLAKVALAEFFSDLDSLQKKIAEIKREGGKVIGFGASGRANMLLSYMSNPELITAVFDESPERIGRTMGFTGIPIRSLETLDQNEYTHCIVLAWNYFDSIREKWPHKGKILISPLPQLVTHET